MPQPTARIRCPRCDQKLRVLHAAEHKRSITCPLCGAAVPLRPHDVFDVEGVPEDTAVYAKEVPTVRVRPQRPVRYQSNWTIGKTIRLALSLVPFAFVLMGSSLFLKSFARFMAAPGPVLGVKFAILLFAEMFWLGMGLWLVNVSDSYDWESIARLLCLGGLVFCMGTVLIAILMGHGNQLLQL